VTVPEGVTAGQQLLATTQWGQIKVTVPTGVTAGQQLRVQFAASTATPAAAAASPPAAATNPVAASPPAAAKPQPQPQPHHQQQQAEKAKFEEERRRQALESMRQRQQQAIAEQDARAPTPPVLLPDEPLRGYWQNAPPLAAPDGCDCGQPRKLVDGIHVCRYFGHYECHMSDCGRRWKSPWCWRDLAVPQQGIGTRGCLPQKCQNCETDTWPYQTDQLDPGRLHAGAVVRVLSASDQETSPYVGETGRLVEVDYQSDRPFKVKFDDGEELWFMEIELERVSVPHDSSRCSMCQRLGYDCSRARGI